MHNGLYYSTNAFKLHLYFCVSLLRFLIPGDGFYD